ncbi:MAG: hypothetical protein R3C05_13020 [Pirellulaceae bacterium]
MEKLEADESIKNEKAALKQWDLVGKLIGSGKAKPSRVSVMLNLIVEKFPGTEAAELAANMLAESGS